MHPNSDCKNHYTSAFQLVSPVITEDQSQVIALLAAPSTHGGAHVDVVETHASIVFLAGTLAFKLKRAVRFDYLDFSTAERRRDLCEAELRLNRQMAPAIYRRVVPVTRSADGSLVLGGRGQPVDWVLEMNRFDQAKLLDKLAARDSLHVDVMTPLAAAIAAFHRTAEPRTDRGGRAGIAWVIDGNRTGLAEFGRDCFDPAIVNRVMDQSLRELDRWSELLERRRASGMVRQCHGDLHLRNIVLLDGRPTPFDGVEFNDDISCIDVQYDLAFLTMDLWRRDLRRHANAVLNGYLGETGDREALPVMPLFLSCRAAVRAKTSVTAASLQKNQSSRDELYEAARRYLSMAEQFLHPPAPSLLAVGGLSGSGKTTLALALAPSVGPAPGGVVLRSDEIRKRLSGVDPLQRLGPEAYAPDVSERVYRTMAEQAAELLRNGHSVIADAVFARPSDRAAIEHVAESLSVPFAGIWLEASEPLLVSRAELRRRDASDATADVIRQQLEQDTGAIGWSRIDASGATASVLESAAETLRKRLPNAFN